MGKQLHTVTLSPSIHALLLSSGSKSFSDYHRLFSLLLCQPVFYTDSDFNYIFTVIVSQPMLFSSQWTRPPLPRPSKQTSMPKQVHTSPLPHPAHFNPAHYPPYVCPSNWGLFLNRTPPRQLSATLSTYIRAHSDTSPSYHITSPVHSSTISSPLLLSLFPSSAVSNALLAASVSPSVSSSVTVNNENLKELDLGSGNKATKGLDYEAEITCANCSA